MARRVTVAEYAELLERASHRGLPDALRRAMTTSALTAEARAKRALTRGGSGPDTRSGRLRNSVRGFARGRGWEQEAVVRADAEYASAHEYGATIRPKRSQYLAIPLDAAKTAAGVARGGPRDFPDLFFIRSKAGNLLLVQAGGDHESGLIPFFALKSEVTIPARPFARPAIERARRDLPRLLGRAVREAVTVEGAA